MSCTKSLIFCDSSPISPVVCPLVGKVTNLDKMRESNLTKGCKPLENPTKRSYSMDFGFAIRMDFAMNTDKLNLVNLVVKVMYMIIFLPKFTEKTSFNGPRKT